MVMAYIGLGSNLELPQQQIESALSELHDLPQSRCLAHSSLYRSAPLIPTDKVSTDRVLEEGKLQGQPDYINAVAALETDLQPQALLEALQSLENTHGRVRSQHWGPRTLDLDLLLYGDMLMDSEKLTIPHPGLYERNFVLYPLLELSTDYGLDVNIPGKHSLRDLLVNCESAGLEKLGH